jgi:Family of unknown function (DUF6338)
MPTTLLGLAIALTFLLPGMCYQFRHRGVNPVSKNVSPVRETSVLIALSLVSNALSLSLFALVKPILPPQTPDVVPLLRDGTTYWHAHTVDLLQWGGLTLALACLIAVVLAAVAENAYGLVTRLPGVEWLLRRSVRTEPAWWLMFTEYRDKHVYVGCELTDGAYLGGLLYTFSPDSDETEDRELTLTGEVIYRSSGDEEEHLLNTGGVIVSARSIRFLTVSYLDEIPETGAVGNSNEVQGEYAI